jgi:hypothetical protein
MAGKKWQRDESRGLRSVRCPLCGGPLFYMPFAAGDLDIRRFVRYGTSFLCTECGYGGAPETTDAERPTLRAVTILEEMRPYVQRAAVKFAYESGAKQAILKSKNLSGEILWWPVGAQWCDGSGRVTRTIDPAIRNGRLVWETRTRAPHAGRPHTVTYEKFSDALNAATRKG